MLTAPSPAAPVHETGVLVIGAGFAGLCAAIEARAAGAAVTLLEPAPLHLRGGNARHCRNIRLANPAETPWQRGSYPPDAFAADLAAMGTPAPDLALVLARQSESLGPWLAAQGVAFEPWADGNLPFSRRTAFLRGGGQALVNALFARAARLGVDIRYGWRVSAFDPKALAQADAGPLAVPADTPEGPRTIRAAAVVLACGGYGADRARLAALLGPAGHGTANRGTPFQRGEPLLWALAHGAAAAGRPGDGHLVAVDARAPMDDAGIVSRMDGMHLGLVVGADGRRLRDERAATGPTRYSIWGRTLAGAPDPRAWLVLAPEALRLMPPMLHPPVRAETPAALAALCGIDAEGLSATLDAIAQHLAGGPEPEPGHTPPAAAPLPRPGGALAAYPMRPGLSFTRHGLAVDADARVRLAAGGTAPRLFAAGAAMGGAVLGEGYLSGTALTIGGVFGRTAGREAAALAGRAVQASAPPRLPEAAAVRPRPEAADPAEEARRALNICNTCGFCTALCDVFPAAQRRPGLEPGDLRHLAHLCHDCGSCQHDCQYASPHAFALDLPAILAGMRAEEYRGGLLPRGRETAVQAALFGLALLGVPLAVLLLAPAGALFGAHAGPGAFYAVIPHGVMAAGAAIGFGGAAAILAVRARLYWRATAGPEARVTAAAVRQALHDVLSLRNLGGGPPGCETRDGPASPARRRFHHLLAGGFLLSFLATLAGAVMHQGFGLVAPYPPLSLPVVLGTVGGVAMLAGLAGLERLARRADPGAVSAAMARADRLLRACLGLVAASGLAVLLLRETAAMGLLLALHLGSVLGLALVLPFGKLSHGVYRGAALLREAAERAARAGR